MNFPPGYRFQPTDEELILSYLEKKAKNEQVPWNPSIIDRDLYGEHATPWYVFSNDDPWVISITRDKDRKKSVKTLYVFTKLVKYGKNRTERRAGCGKWDGQTRVPIINNFNGEKIGSRRMLSFEARENPDAVKMTNGHWIMHEYSLDDSVNEHTSNDYVICKITRTLTEPRDQPVVPFADEIGTSIRGGENPRIDEELSKKRYTTVEDCPHANKKEKVQGPSMEDMREEEIFGNLADIEDISFEFPVTGEEFPARDLDLASYDNPNNFMNLDDYRYNFYEPCLMY